MVEGDQELDQYFVENYFYTEYGHKDVERAYTKMSWTLLGLLTSFTILFKATQYSPSLVEVNQAV